MASYLFGKIRGLFQSNPKRNHNNDNTEQNTDLSEGIVLAYCDGCTSQIFENNARFTCLDCSNFDFCSDCMNNEEIRGSHSAHHLFVQEEITYHQARETVKSKNTFQESMTCAFEMYKNRPYLGIISKTQDGTYSLEWKTFKEVNVDVLMISKGIEKLYQKNENILRFIGVCGLNSYNLAVCDLAGIHQGFVTIPIHVNLDEESLVYIISSTEIFLIFCDSSQVSLIKSLKEKLLLPKLLYIITIDEGDDKGDMNLETLKNVAELDEILIPHQFDKEDVFTIIHTSGSTGVPKGAIFKEKAWNYGFKKVSSPRPLVDVCFNPYAHSTPRRIVHSSLFKGGMIAMFPGPAEDIYTILQLVNPTVVSSTPRLWNVLYDQYTSMVEATYQKAIKQRNSQQETNDNEIDKKTIEKEVFQLFRGVLGSRVAVIVTGGAPTSEKVLEFLNRFDAMMFNGYGTTETSGIYSGSHIIEDVEVTLVDVPEMGYFTTDKPFPRGEILVKSPGMVSGYHKNEESTAESFDENGFFHTGDIGVLVDGKRVKIIDRKKNFFKLAQGQYVAAEFLETTFLESKFISQIYIHSDSLKSFLICIVYPNYDAIHLEENESIEDLVLKDMFQIGFEHKLKSFEIPRRALIIKDPFTEDNGFLTKTKKMQRHKIKKHYQAELDEIFEQIKDQNSLQFELQYTLNTSQLNGKTFKEMGGDSLSAVQIQKVLKDFNHDVPIDVIMSETIEGILSFKSSKREIFSGNFMDDISLPDDFNLDHAFMEESESDVVLLTGATGFLGAYLLYNLVNFKRKDMCRVKKIYCLVRGASKLSAREKLLKTLDSYRLSIDEDQFKKVIVVPGDLSKDKMGMKDSTYAKLSKDVTSIYHCAAWVNSIFNYESLRDANVLGTKRLLSFAVKDRIKYFHFISSTSVMPDRRNKIGRESRRTDKDELYNIGGYGRSKWVAERIMYLAFDKGLKGTICRPSTISGDENGSSNRLDLINKMIASFLILKGMPEPLNDVLNLVPVDYASKSIIYLGQRSKLDENITGKIFNIVNVENLSWDIVRDCLENEYEVKKLPYKDWVEEINTNKHKVLESLRGVFIKDSRSTSEVQYDCSNTLEFIPNKVKKLCRKINREELIRIVNFIQENMI